MSGKERNVERYWSGVCDDCGCEWDGIAGQTECPNCEGGNCNARDCGSEGFGLLSPGTPWCGGCGGPVDEVWGCKCG